MENRCKLTKTDLLWLLAFLLGFVFVLNKCRFGFVNIDEAYYLTIPYRFLRGDAMFLEEWNLAQTSSLLICPFLWAYLGIVGTTEGILLAFRYVYTVLHGMTAVFVYVRLRRKNWGAAFASLLYLMFTPFGIMAMSYNSMAIGLIVIASILVYTNQKNSPLLFVIAGSAFAGAVLCCPHLVLAYFACGFGILAYRFVPGGAMTDARRISWQGFLWFTLGCGIAAALFFAVLFRGCTLSELLKVIPIILDDPRHVSVSLADITRLFVTEILYSNRLAPRVFACAAALALLVLLDRNREKRKQIYFFAALALTAVYTIPFVKSNADLNYNPFINHMMFPLTILGFFCFLIQPKSLSREWLLLWLPGFLYAFCINWASNQKMNAISDAVCISSLGSIVMAAAVLSGEENRKQWIGKLSRCVLALFLVGFVLCTARIRYHTVFWEHGPMQAMTYEISMGSQKGILSSASLGSAYEAMYQQTQPVREDPSDKVLYYTYQTWLYLEDDKENASYSSWLTADDYSSDRLVRYYEINPEKLPDLVYAPHEFWREDSSLARYFDELGYRTTETTETYALLRR